MIWETEDIGSLWRKRKFEKGGNDSLSIKINVIIIHKSMNILTRSLFSNNNNNNNNEPVSLLAWYYGIYTNQRNAFILFNYFQNTEIL